MSHFPPLYFTCNGGSSFEVNPCEPVERRGAKMEQLNEGHWL